MDKDSDRGQRVLLWFILPILATAGVLFPACDGDSPSQPAPEPTPDIEATVTARVAAALSTQTTPSPMPGPAPILSSDEAEEFIANEMWQCERAWRMQNFETEARYVGDHLWFVSAKGRKGSTIEKPGFYIWSSGRWRLDELTGDLRPYDDWARFMEERGLEECLEMRRNREKEEVHHNLTFGYSVRVPQGWALTRQSDDVWVLRSDDRLGLYMIHGESNLDLSLDEFHDQYAIPILNEYSSRNNNECAFRGPLPITIAGRSTLLTDNSTRIAGPDRCERYMGVRSVVSATNGFVLLRAVPEGTNQADYIRDTFIESLR